MPTRTWNIIILGIDCKRLHTFHRVMAGALKHRVAAGVPWRKEFTCLNGLGCQEATGDASVGVSRTIQHTLTRSVNLAFYLTGRHSVNLLVLPTILLYRWRHMFVDIYAEFWKRRDSFKHTIMHGICVCVRTCVCVCVGVCVCKYPTTY
jgi:hypothetical protein